MATLSCICNYPNTIAHTGAAFRPTFPDFSSRSSRNICKNTISPEIKSRSRKQFVAAPNSLDQHFARLESDNCQTHEQPYAIGPFRMWIVRRLAHALNKYFVSQLLSLNTLSNNVLNGLQFTLSAQLTACIFAQILNCRK